MLTPRSALYSAALVLCLGLPLVACDEKSAAQEQAQEQPAAQTVEAASGEEALPEAAPENSGAESVTAESSMAEDSPAGEGVTAEEIPHSDVPPPSREVFTDAACDFEAWVGKPVAEAEAAAKETGRVYRILKPDSMMTMDHNPERINVVHDEDGKVTRVWCG